MGYTRVEEHHRGDGAEEYFTVVSVLLPPTGALVEVSRELG